MQDGSKGHQTSRSTRVTSLSYWQVCGRHWSAHTLIGVVIYSLHVSGGYAGNFYNKYVHELSPAERKEIDDIMQMAVDEYDWGYPDGYNPMLTPLRHTLVCIVIWYW